MAEKTFRGLSLDDLIYIHDDHALPTYPCVPDCVGCAVVDALRELKRLMPRLEELSGYLDRVVDDTSMEYQFCECGAFFNEEDDGAGQVWYEEDEYAYACPKCYAEATAYAARATSGEVTR